MLLRSMWFDLKCSAKTSRINVMMLSATGIKQMLGSEQLTISGAKT